MSWQEFKKKHGEDLTEDQMYYLRMGYSLAMLDCAKDVGKRVVDLQTRKMVLSREPGAIDELHYFFKKFDQKVPRED